MREKARSSRRAGGGGMGREGERVVREKALSLPSLLQRVEAIRDTCAYTTHDTATNVQLWYTVVREV